MKKFSPKTSRKAFTLMELLAVVAIIGILMALLLPVIASAIQRGYKVKALAAIMDTVNGIRGFETEYSRLPRLGHSGGGDLAVTTESEQARLYNVLRAREVKGGVPASDIENTKGIVYTGTYPVVGHAAPRGGFTTAGALFDPWGRLFVFALDSDGDNIVDLRSLGVVPEPGQDPEITTRVLGLSHGQKDGSDQQKDDVKNW